MKLPKKQIQLERQCCLLRQLSNYLPKTNGATVCDGVFVYSMFVGG